MTIVDREGFSVIGIETRTTNAREMAPGGTIPKMWERFMKEGLAEKIPNRAGTSLIALYTDYESDADGEYSFVVGAPVAEGATPPDGMSLKQVPAGRYWKLTTEQGPVWEVVPNAWKRVWQESGVRAFRTDFEIYDERAANPANAVVEVWVGVR